MLSQDVRQYILCHITKCVYIDQPSWRLVWVKPVSSRPPCWALYILAGLWIAGQLHPEYPVCSLPALQHHCFHSSVAAIQCGRAPVPQRRPALCHRLPASCQKDPADRPTRNLCKYLQGMGRRVTQFICLDKSLMGFQYGQGLTLSFMCYMCY